MVIGIFVELEGQHAVMGAYIHGYRSINVLVKEVPNFVRDKLC